LERLTTHYEENFARTSVARLISVIQFTFDPRLSQSLDYLDSCAPSIKVSLLRRLSIVARGHRMANIAAWHSEKAPPQGATDRWPLNKYKMGCYQ
jgi:hypothetical protein